MVDFAQRISTVSLFRILRALDMRQWKLISRLRAVLAFVPLLLLLPHTLGLRNYEPLVRIDQRVYDRRLIWFDLDGKRDERIVIVDVDEQSLKQYGRWPWGRDTIAQLTAELMQRQEVTLLGFDMLFAEPDESEDVRTIREWLEEQVKAGDTRRMHDLELLTNRDRNLANVLEQKPVVLSYYFSSDPTSGQNGALPHSLPVRLTQPLAGLPRIEGYAANLRQLVDAAPVGGFINAITDSDGELRSIPLVAQQGEGAAARYYPSLSLAMFMALLGQPEVHLLPMSQYTHPGAAHHLAHIELQQGQDRLRIPTDPHGTMLVPYRSTGGREGGQFRYVSAADVLDGRLSPKELQGRIVLVGSSAAGLRDLRVTPVSNYFPGVEIHAASLSAMLDGKFIHYPDYIRGYDTLIVALVTLLLAFLLPRVNAWSAWLWCTGFILLLTLINGWFYVQAHVALPLGPSVIAVLMTYILHMSYGFFLESRAKKQLASLFGHYIPAELVSQMVQEPERYSAQAQARELTIMFCDIQHFTTIAEKMGPVEVQDLLNRLFNRIAAIIAPNQGTIDKYIGDSVMAFWGAPLPLGNHAPLAVKSAIEITAMLEDFNQEQEKLGQPTIRVNIGLNSGVVSVGDMGSVVRRSYTVLGDAVNVASRLEPLAKRYGVPMTVGERTVELAPSFAWQWLDRVRVAGKAQAIDIYTPLTLPADVRMPDEEAQLQELDTWKRFTIAYSHRDWEAGLALLDELQVGEPDKPLYNLYRERLQAFLFLPPPPDWDGVTDSAK
ncbi:MAG: adenylate/guanylate cyclase domain-containing protein [Brachymonas sp.]|nr:adenylate/guanylate cyclase domain-containing protein [Brachymonas sp.]